MLGSGLGAFADELTDRVEIPYADIPGWPASTAVGHAGRLVFGNLGNLRWPRWPGASTSTKATRRSRLLSACVCSPALACTSMVFTNAAGGINLKLGRGGLVLISDHINLQGSNPLVRTQ